MGTYGRVGFEEVGRLPDPRDNAAIAVRTLKAGTRVEYGDDEIVIRHDILEGHRFAVRTIRRGEPLLSWGLPFGEAVRVIPPGGYLCNEKILRVLEGRRVGLKLPQAANFADAPLLPYRLDEARFRPAEQVPLRQDRATFYGYRRGGGRGVGTRNHVVILGITSRTGSFAKALERRMGSVAEEYPGLDGIVAVAHTEGGEDRTPNNLDLLLRTLAGFMVHPNVGAVLAVDEPGASVTGEMVRRYAEERGYPLGDVPHHFMTLDCPFETGLRRAESIVAGWLGEVGCTRRTEEPLCGLKIALQCGGSDAFSGISANPLAGWVAREVLRNGGSANLAETDELIGAEEYVLSRVRDLDVARRFLSMVERFKERVAWHGHTAEGNPSGGNNFRGLYNISIKSIGAARKKDPQVRLDEVVEYGERMDEPGFYFMDSPGNDLESIAGQVASGANMIFFTTGNGSITNFPFVPTVKFVTTTGRYRLLEDEMDVNAGAYLDGTPMEELGRSTFELTLRVASGEKTAGERAGHSQVSIWREWRQTGPGNLDRLLDAPTPDGEPLAVPVSRPSGRWTYEAVQGGRGPAADRVGLIMPTSLCSGQIALRIAGQLNERGLGAGRLSRFVALPHTEGCGVSGGSSEEIYSRTVLGYLTHPLVGVALLLEHGCEKTHNDYFRALLSSSGLDPEAFGWASIQLDGGIERVTRKVGRFFEERLGSMGEMEGVEVGLGNLRLGLHAAGVLPDEAALALAGVTLAVVGAGGTVVVPERGALLESRAYRQAILGDVRPRITLAYGQVAENPGLHVMETPTTHWVETATGMGATGVEVMLAHVVGRPLQAHRMVQLVQVSSDPGTVQQYAEDLDAVLTGDAERWTESLMEAIMLVASRRYRPRLFGEENVAFQLTRGLLGVSM